MESLKNKHSHNPYWDNLLSLTNSKNTLYPIKDIHKITKYRYFAQRKKNFKKLDSLLSFPLPDFVEEILILIYLGFIYSYKVVKES